MENMYQNGLFKAPIIFDNILPKQNNFIRILTHFYIF